MTTRVDIDGDASGAINAIRRLRSELGGLESLAKTAFGFAAAGLSAASLVAYTKSIIDAADAINEMSERTGVAVEDISRLQYAAKLSGVESEQLGKALHALSVEIFAAGAGSQDSLKNFEKLGISVRDASTQKIRPAKDILLDLADAFALLPEGAEKSSTAVDFFKSKLGAEMIPLLSAGRAGIEAMGDELERLGGLMTSDTAKAAAEFNDNLDRLKTTSTQAGIAIANALLPTLNKLTNEFLLRPSPWSGWCPSRRACL